LPIGAGAFSPRTIAIVTDAAALTPAKHIIFFNGPDRSEADTSAATIGQFLLERGITPDPHDSVSPPADAPVADGTTLTYRRAVPVEIVADGTTTPVVTAVPTVGAVLAEQHVPLGSHDRVDPPVNAAVTANGVIRIARTTSWLEHVRAPIVPPVSTKFDIALRPGNRRLIDAGSAGVKETTVEVLQPRPDAAPERLVLSARILRFPRSRVIAEGVGDYSALAGLARRGMTGTMRLADQALRMVATAYTAACSGCSGTTASGRPAGHGVVAVDPRYIPLGSHLFIPGYGHAYAGDTGGAIRGNRIDLGFDSERDAMVFGRRPIVVYVLK
jgi:3D (Asp-Asp-Asp) domain-containing protein